MSEMTGLSGSPIPRSYPATVHDAVRSTRLPVLPLLPLEIEPRLSSKAYTDIVALLDARLNHSALVSARDQRVAHPSSTRGTVCSTEHPDHKRAAARLYPPL